MLRFASLAKQRRLVLVRGPDAAAFLQSFGTVDVRKLPPSGLVFGAFLNPKGRVMHDFFLHQQQQQGGDQVFELETPAESTPALVDYLLKFKFRKKVQVTVDDTRSVFAVWGSGGFADPRFADMPQRVWSASAPSASEVSADDYTLARMRAGLCEGHEESFEKVPFQLNYDFIPAALAYDKGCYTGQELIARTHFKGQVRKRVLPVELLVGDGGDGDGLVVGGSIEPESETGVGEGTVVAVAPNNAKIGLAAFRDADLVQSTTTTQQPTTHKLAGSGGGNVRLTRPAWWPPAAAAAVPEEA